MSSQKVKESEAIKMKEDLAKAQVINALRSDRFLTRQRFLQLYLTARTFKN